MKKALRILFKTILVFISIPIIYLLFALLLSYIPSRGAHAQKQDNHIYIGTNGVHLDLILPISSIDSSLLQQLDYAPSDSFLAFGWGDENFYLHTPTWNDLTLNTAVNALFLESSTLIHLSPYASAQRDWTKIPVQDSQLSAILDYLHHSFQKNGEGKKQQIAQATYGYGDSFYKAEGNYSCFKTCNSWVNMGLKKAQLPACFWTPFDFPVLAQYR